MKPCKHDFVETPGTGYMGVPLEERCAKCGLVVMGPEYSFTSSLVDRTAIVVLTQKDASGTKQITFLLADKDSLEGINNHMRSLTDACCRERKRKHTGGGWFK